jgi:hypothetical protein
MTALQMPLKARLPRATDRVPLGLSGLAVSPLCLGITADPAVVPAAFDAGVNFFFLTADLHWPLYEGLRRGLELLLARSPSVRDQIVVGVVSYLDEPLFQYLQFHEVTQSVRGLERVDVLVAGAVPGTESFNTRYASLAKARANRHAGAVAIGASFHDRATALGSLNLNCLDLHLVRYNTGHPGARHDLFPLLREDRVSPIYTFKSTFSQVTEPQFRRLGLTADRWVPRTIDYYRFVLSHPAVAGVLCSPMSVPELHGLIDCLGERPLTPSEEEYMMWLSAIATPEVF